MAAGKRPPMPAREISEQPLQRSLVENRQALEEILGQSDDVIWRDLKLGQPERQGVLIYLDGLVNPKLIQEGIMDALRSWAGRPQPGAGTPAADGAAPAGQESLSGPAELAAALGVTTPGIALAKTLGEVAWKVQTGHASLLLEGWGQALCCSVQGWGERPVEKPDSEATVRGPKQAFVENLRVNTALLRRTVASPRLRIEQHYAGRLSQTRLAICYLADIADPQVLAETRQRLAQIDIDTVQDSSYVEELIEDQPFSPFPLIKHSERPDTVAADLCEGRVAILVDGSPECLIVPGLFVDFMQAAEDYYERFPLSAAVRSLRIGLILISLLLPAVWVSLVTFHQETLPTMLLLRLAAAREGIPFSAGIEAILMEVAFEALREAGLRLPKPIGPAVSIVGALVIGESAVRAGLASPPMVVIVAMTGIASFAVPRYAYAIGLRILRFGLLVLAAVSGLFGVGIGLLLITVHLASAQSFGVAYTSGIAPFDLEAQQDIITRLPRWLLRRRPALAGTNRVRTAQKPLTSGNQPPKGGST